MGGTDHVGKRTRKTADQVRGLDVPTIAKVNLGHGRELVGLIKRQVYTHAAGPINHLNDAVWSHRKRNARLLYGDTDAVCRSAGHAIDVEVIQFSLQNAVRLGHNVESQIGSFALAYLLSRQRTRGL